MGLSGISETGRLGEQQKLLSTHRMNGVDERLLLNMGLQYRGFKRAGGECGNRAFRQICLERGTALLLRFSLVVSSSLAGMIFLCQATHGSQRTNILPSKERFSTLGAETQLLGGEGSFDDSRRLLQNDVKPV